MRASSSTSSFSEGREARRFTLKLAAFAVLTGAVLGGLSLACRRAARLYRDPSATICAAKRSAVRSGQLPTDDARAGVLFLGNSQLLFGLAPLQFDGLTGATCAWNLALPALPIGPNYFELCDYLEQRPRPEYIVLYLSLDSPENYLFDQYALEGLTLPELASYMIERRSKTIGLNYVCPTFRQLGALAHYVRDACGRPERLSELEEKQSALVLGMLEARGHFAVDRRLTEPPQKNWQAQSDVAEPVLNLANDPYVGRFFDLAAERGIQVLLIEPPGRPGQRASRGSMPAHYRELLAKYPNARMAAAGWRPKIYPPELFCDAVHLNRAGAERFTREIAAEFEEVFGARLAAWRSTGSRTLR